MTQASQLRYIFYFEKLLQGRVAIPRRLLLQRIIIERLPTVKRHFNMQAIIYNGDYEGYFANDANSIEPKMAG